MARRKEVRVQAPLEGQSKRQAVEKLFLLAQACGSQRITGMNCIGGGAPLRVRIVTVQDFSIVCSLGEI